jgi:hypothetical protein
MNLPALTTAVIAGFDPAIHGDGSSPASAMDARVKPGHDESDRHRIKKVGPVA